MGTDKLDQSLIRELQILETDGLAKPPERIIEHYLPPKNPFGPRYLLKDCSIEFIRMNSNSYLSLSHHPALLAAADEAAIQFGVGPGAVRFIDGTFTPHVQLEDRIAAFVGKPAGKIFNSAYTANCGLALALSSEKTFWITDQLNHNSIIRAMRISNVPSKNKCIYPHNDMAGLKKCLEAVPPDMERVLVIFDGIFSMRGDYAPIQEINALCRKFSANFKDGVISIVDDSHGIGAFGSTGRGTSEFCGESSDIIVGTFGKAFGVNGGFVAASQRVIEAVRQKADTYIYTNPLSAADCAAAITAIDLCDSDKGAALLKTLQANTRRFRAGLKHLGLESIDGPHPVVPLMVRDTAGTRALVNYLFENGVLVVGISFPVVPRGEEALRFQLNACHTPADIDHVIDLLDRFKLHGG